MPGDVNERRGCELKKGVQGKAVKCKSTCTTCKNHFCQQQARHSTYVPKLRLELYETSLRLTLGFLPGLRFGLRNCTK